MRGPQDGRLGPWMTLALVVGSIIGAGIFMLPVSLAPLGANAVVGWIISGLGAVCIAFALGYAEAMEPTFLYLRESEEWIQRKAREAILAHTDATGSDAEIVKWYEARKGRLHWDREQKKYREAGK